MSGVLRRDHPGQQLPYDLHDDALPQPGAAGEHLAAYRAVNRLVAELPRRSGTRCGSPHAAFPALGQGARTTDGTGAERYLSRTARPRCPAVSASCR
ncbi:hypothetical protein GCM10018980_15900 [Streptomyces capoamus]|uniref:Uncharacterized protein n=1 Tax=Streptomyces capoamus TaxID=68183 RepID=A0A919C3D1_9ACTN|nr:hypothetical protein GCM10010501_18630 [Streptomyces libani subsp. rufus]GHG41068.1 hypothetical protein GCM10018980_15900 [Streptomyces capoamus]